MSLVTAFLLLILPLTSSQSDYGDVSIDCGQEDYVAQYNDNITWYSDRSYIRSGYNHKINNSINDNPMNSLRIFPDMNKNCYTIPAFVDQKYLLRAGFFYGNYDGQSRPPTFHLHFDASLWTTVVTSIDQPVFYEAIVVAKRRNVSVCVARREDRGVTFISSLQMMQLLPGMYSDMEALADRALFTQYRVNFGSNETVRYPDDKYGRIWEPAQTPGYINISADIQSLNSTIPDDPPLAAVKTAIQAASPSDPITLYFNIQPMDRPTYITIYFTEVAKLSPGQNRTFDIFLNGQDYNLRVSPIYQKCNEVHGSVDSTGKPFNLTIAPSEKSSMPPIVSAMELYTVSDIVSNGTSLDDIFGLQRVTDYSSSLARWSGDPCLPIAWEWLACNQDNPPRVTALYLANYDIRRVRDFTKMQALEIVELQDNNITGHIPEFFGDLPNLKILNLANNDLWGSVPESLLNDKLSLNISGNPLLTIPERKKNKKGNNVLILGIVIVFIVVIITCILVVFFCRRARGIKNNTVELGRANNEIEVGRHSERDPGTQRTED